MIEIAKKVRKPKKKCPSCGKRFSGRSKYCSYLCAGEAILEADKQLKEKKGPIYEKWREKCLISLRR